MKQFNLPEDHRPYIDKYFLRAKEILQKENLNPVVKVQVFIRKGGVNVYGIDEAVAILIKYAKDVRICALNEGDHFDNGEVVMTIEAPIQEIIDLETMYLGVLSAETTLQNGGRRVYPSEVFNNMEKIVKLVAPRPVSYFGARHWRYNNDGSFAGACCAAGAANCSTDIGAKAWGKDCKGVGTIPHSLEAIYHWKYGLINAVKESTKAFDQYMDIDIPRVALVDYANQEVTDSLRIAHIVDAVRIDTCGENIMEGVLRPPGVGIGGVYCVRRLLDNNHFNKVKIILSSGFGNVVKVKAFLDAEKALNIKLFDGLGVGGVFESRMATADIIEVYDREVHKVGREPKPNERLKRIV